jgi:hypothetical protein
VRVIPHGVPAAPDLDQEHAKELVGLSGRTVLLTFGLIGPDKGIEVVIDALPAVVAETRRCSTSWSARRTRTSCATTATSTARRSRRASPSSG